MSVNKVVYTAGVLLMCISFSASKKPIASYIHPCFKSAADFDQCCLEHGKEALPRILKGDKEYKIPVLSPFLIPLISLDTGILKVAIKDLHIYGFDTHELKQVKIDLDNKKIEVKIFFGVLNIAGDFEIDGKILMIPIKGSGNTNITAVGVDVIYSLNYKTVMKDGDEYLYVDSATADFTCATGSINMNDVLENKEIGDAVNKALNENWNEFVNSIKPVITQSIVEVGNSIINGFGSSVPIKDIFPE